MTTPLPTTDPSYWPYERIIRYKTEVRAGRIQRYAFVKWEPMWVSRATWNAKKDDPTWWIVNYTGYFKEVEKRRSKVIIHWKNSWIQIENIQ